MEYTEKNILLAESIVVHSPRTAEVINNILSLGGYQVPSDKKAWKYYLNLSGRYHETDEPIFVKSYDTGERILFSIENLNNHKITQRMYRWGSANLNRLFDEHPLQSDIITGVVQPVDLERAIASEEHSILTYCHDLVEYQEATLIPELENWIKRNLTRWDVAGFNKTDNLYEAGRLGILYLNLPGAIISLREDKKKTHEVNSSLIEMHLSSKLNIDGIFKHIPWHSAIWLYRNIDRLRALSGTNKVFDDLIENLFKRGVSPLQRLTMYQDSSNLPSELIPKVVVDSDPIISNTNHRKLDNYESLIESTFRPGLSNYDDHMLRVGLNKNGYVWTRFLESSVGSFSIEGPNDFYSHAVKHWLAYAYADIYQDEHYILAPGNQHHVKIDTRTAAILFMICMSKASPANVTHVGEVCFQGIRRKHNISLGQAMRHLNNGVDETAVRIFLRGALSLPNNVDKSTFAAWANLSYYQQVRQFVYLANTEDLVDMTLLQDIYNQQFVSDVYSIEETFEMRPNNCKGGCTLFGIDMSGYVKEDYLNLAKILIEACVPLESHTGAMSVSQVHSAMIKIFKQLISYDTTVMDNTKDVVHLYGGGNRNRPTNVIVNGEQVDNADYQLLAASIVQTETGEISDRYVSPYTLGYMLDRLEKRIIGQMDDYLAHMTSVYNEETDLLEQFINQLNSEN